MLWCGLETLLSARLFYGYLLKQTGGEWSAPLDDVFIHFDYARATALGHPFEWTIGNGYSSGNTSLTYPFVLALGWLVGFQGRRLMVWAAIVAALSVFGLLLAARRLFLEHEHDTWGRIASYLLPPIVLGVGALDWSLWSGMEVAFFLGTWALALVAWLALERDGARGSRRRVAHRAWALGLAGGLMVVTRPEAALTIAIFGVAAAFKNRRVSHPLALLFRVGMPAALLLGLQSFANRQLTGEWSANGAIVKLALNNPYMTPVDKWNDWLGNVQYAVTRVLDYHFADIAGEHASALVPDAWDPNKNPLAYLAKTAWWAGIVPLVLAVLPLLFARTRRIALVLWAQVVGWYVIVALNGQVRWQNERYVMPAVAWVLILAALGVSVAFRAHARAKGRGGALRPSLLWGTAVGALIIQTIGVLTRPPGPPHFRFAWVPVILVGALSVFLFWYRGSRVALVLVALVFAYDHQIPKMRDQKWFFGRAARNIRDQHLTLGAYLRELNPKRVLVGDAGAILYESDRPGLDIIGLGGYGALPFARAGVHGMPATLELIERIPPADRPDVLAIFPTWWGDLPLLFSSEVMRRFPVEGNVICGGYEHVVYRADWHLLDTGAKLRQLPRGDAAVRVEIDVGDLVSEAEHGYVFEHPSNGWTDMRVLPDPADDKKDLFDAGRRIAVGKREWFVVRGARPGTAGHLVVRTAPESTTRVRVRVGGADVGAFELARTGGWVEPAIAVPAERMTPDAVVELLNEGPGDFVDFHAWVTQ